MSWRASEKGAAGSAVYSSPLAAAAAPPSEGLHVNLGAGETGEPEPAVEKAAAANQAKQAAKAAAHKGNQVRFVDLEVLKKDARDSGLFPVVTETDFVGLVDAATLPPRPPNTSPDNWAMLMYGLAIASPNTTIVFDNLLELDRCLL
jgi:hypothetical protein